MQFCELVQFISELNQKPFNFSIKLMWFIDMNNREQEYIQWHKNQRIKVNARLQKPQFFLSLKSSNTVQYIKPKNLQAQLG